MKRTVIRIPFVLALSLQLAASALFLAANSGAAVAGTAFEELSATAEQGDADAQFNLGFMYAEGKGVPQDYAAAVKWYRKAAKQGYAHAQLKLGNMYCNGKGVPQDYAAAVKWYRKAAEQGNAFAQSNLGVMYDNGEGVPQNYIQAHMWFNLAAANGNKNAIKNRDNLAQKMTPSQVEKAQRLAHEWRPAVSP